MTAERALGGFGDWILWWGIGHWRHGYVALAWVRLRLKPKIQPTKRTRATIHKIGYTKPRPPKTSAKSKMTRISPICFFSDVFGRL
jgi:hypothetical protein